MAEPTAITLVVGDELLAGHTLDTNSHFLAERLRERGVRLARRETVPDEPTEISRALKRALDEDRPGHVFVLGGIGPTPDDRTYEGVARALGVPLEVPAQGQAWMERVVRERGYGADLWKDPAKREPLLRMVRLPRGAAILENPAGLALGCAAASGPTTIFVLPGVPREFEAMLVQVVEPRYLSGFRPSDMVRELEVYGEEARLFDVMTEVERAWPQVKIGSYPHGAGRVVLRLAGPERDVTPALEHVRGATESMRRPRP